VTFVLYRNEGNAEALALLPAEARRVLDVGCGAGDNARLMTASGRIVTGITWSEAEAALAAPHLDRVLVADIETGELPLTCGSFEALLLSHVIEHVRDPAALLRRLAPLLGPAGVLVVAVPNMAHWRLRWRFARGDWRREDSGPLDRTHLQFWSYQTAPGILDGTPFTLERREAGQLSVPLWPLRRMAPSLCRRMDARVGEWNPNLFAGQVLVRARLRRS
jgi:SAM-dependent methyltransferase